MPVCEKCWADAYRRAMGSGRSQTDHYYKLLEERKYHPCAEEAGNEEQDSRDTVE